MHNFCVFCGGVNPYYQKIVYMYVLGVAFRLFGTRNPDAWGAIHACWDGEDVRVVTILPLSYPAELDSLSPRSLALDTSEVTNATGQEAHARDAVYGLGFHR